MSMRKKGGEKGCGVVTNCSRCTVNKLDLDYCFLILKNRQSMEKMMELLLPFRLAYFVRTLAIISAMDLCKRSDMNT